MATAGETKMEPWVVSENEIQQFLEQEVKDLNRARVFALLPELLDEIPESCRCVECIADVAAFTLSKLTPDYRWAPSAEAYPYKVTEETLRSTIRRGIHVIAANPRGEHHLVADQTA